MVLFSTPHPQFSIAIESKPVSLPNNRHSNIDLPTDTNSVDSCQLLQYPSQL